MKLFKWISILVVVALILLFAVGSIIPGDALTRAKRTNAEVAAQNLKRAISAYRTEYHEYPLLDPANDLTVDSGHDLMDILLGSDKQKGLDGRNPRGIAFYTDRAAKPYRDGRFRFGITLDDRGAGELWDSWGNHYRIRFDTNGDGRVENPETPGTHLPESIAVWSAGPDGEFETWDDNVKSW